MRKLTRRVLQAVSVPCFLVGVLGFGAVLSLNQGELSMAAEKFTLKVSGIQDGQTIPKRFTGEGEDVSPSVQWSGAPAGTREFALLCEDPDAPTPEPWVHWIVYNISPKTAALPEGIPQKGRTEAKVKVSQGKTSFGKTGYNGPMPPVGHGVHHYIFKVYALNSELAIPPGADKKSFLKAIQGHVLGEAQVVGLYERS